MYKRQHADAGPWDSLWVYDHFHTTPEPTEDPTDDPTEDPTTSEPGPTPTDPGDPVPTTGAAPPG